MNTISSIKDNNRRVLITGSSSGIGYQAALALLNAGFDLILPCRNAAKAKFLLERLEKETTNKSSFRRNTYAPILDLSDLSSIENCAKQLLQRDKIIDTIILNAGLQYTGAKQPKWSAQNFELTFAVNHLGHQYLTLLILPLLFKSNKPRILITASDVHNPEAPGGKIGEPAGLGKLDGIRKGKMFLMIDGNLKFNADKAYKDSKLCNILFAKELYNRISSSGRHIPVIAWAPGLVIPRTKKGFFRYSRKYNEFGQIIFAFIVRDLLRLTETPENAGKHLFKLASDNQFYKQEFNYFSNKVKSPGKRIFEISEVSNEANDSLKAKSLWDITLELIRKNVKFNIDDHLSKLNL